VGLREVGFLVVGLDVGLFVAVVVGGVGDGGVGPAMQMLGLNPPLSGVHLSTPLEYIPLQHPFMHWEFEEHCSQSPSDPVVGEVGVVGVVGVVVGFLVVGLEVGLFVAVVGGGVGDGGVGEGEGTVALCQSPISSRVITCWLL